MQEPSLIIVLGSIVAGFGGVLAFVVFRARAARRTLSEAGSHYHALIEQSPNGVLIADAATFRVLAANTALQRSLGYSLDELRSLSLGQLFTDELAEGDSLPGRLRNP